MRLDQLIAERGQGPTVSVVDGVMVADASGNLAVNIGGIIHTPPVVGRWSLTVGQPVQVLIVGTRMQILGPLVNQRPAKGTVKTWTTGSDTLTVMTSAGDITAQRLLTYTPKIGDVVALLWQQDPPFVVGAISTLPEPTPTPGPDGPPPGPGVGTARYMAVDSGSWTSSGGWSNTQRTNVMQGTGYGLTCQGIWLYGGAPAGLRGRTITRCRIRIGPRRHVGSYNSPLAFSVVLHPHETRPGGQLTVLGTQMSPGFPDGHTDWVELPAGWGQTLVDNGGGLGLSGGAYGGSAGIRDGNPESGLVELDWST